LNAGRAAADRPDPFGGRLNVRPLRREELEALMAGLLVSRAQPRGTTRFTGWLDANGPWLGRRYLNEVERHFATA